MTNANTPPATLLPCPFCGGRGKMIHPMGVWISKDIGYGPDGRRVICTSQAPTCHAMTPAFYGPDADAQAITAWNTRTPPATPARQVEWVARAICRSRIGNMSDEGLVQRIVDASWTAYELDARAAIAAMSPAVGDDVGQKPVQPDNMYVIRKGAYYYRPNAQGYTGDINQAGRFTLDEAIKYSHPNGRGGPRDGIDYLLAPPAVPDLAREVARLREALRPFAEKRTTQELHDNPEPAWPPMPREMLIEKLVQNSEQRDSEILAARAALKQGGV